MSEILAQALAASILEAGAWAELLQGPAGPSYLAGIKTLYRKGRPDLLRAYRTRFRRISDFKFYNIYEAKLYVDEVYQKH